MITFSIVCSIKRNKIPLNKQSEKWLSQFGKVIYTYSDLDKFEFEMEFDSLKEEEVFVYELSPYMEL